MFGLFNKKETAICPVCLNKHSDGNGPSLCREHRNKTTTHTYFVEIDVETNQMAGACGTVPNIFLEDLFGDIVFSNWNLDNVASLNYCDSNFMETMNGELARLKKTGTLDFLMQQNTLLGLDKDKKNEEVHEYTQGHILKK